LRVYEFDVSIVLNVHNEAIFLRRTLLSIEDAARFARLSGITIELIVVLDSATPETAAWLKKVVSDAFNDIMKINVSNGSLGPSRNAGIRAARGEFILTADGDDLISYNTISAFVALARNTKEKALLFPQFYIGFGDNDHIYKMFGTDILSSLAFIEYHPFVSRIFCRTDDLLSLPYSDARLSSGVAFEDWHHNMEAVARDFQLIVAKDIIVYYRGRPKSLLRNALAVSACVTAATDLFKPEVYLSKCARDYENYCLRLPSFPNAASIRKEFMDNAVCREVTLVASRIDPGISLATASVSHAFSSMEGDLRPGLCYYRMCQAVGQSQFDDILLVPGPVQSYNLQILSALKALDPQRRLLVIAGQSGGCAPSADQLPPNAVFIDLFAEGHDLSERQRQILTLRLIQSVAPSAVVHILNCPFANNFIMRFADLLSGTTLVYYRTGDAHYQLEEGWFVQGDAANFLSEIGWRLDMIVCDNSKVARSDIFIFDTLGSKYKTLSPMVTGSVDAAPCDRPLKHQLLWASSLEPQKRPELLTLIARLLAEQMPNLRINLYGSSPDGEFDPNKFADLSNLHYFGAFDGFDSLPYAENDAFLYTSAYDGIPSIILEAMRAGLTAFAPDVGGLSEIISPNSGYIIPNNCDNLLLAQAYVDAIKEFYGNKTDRIALRREAKRLVEHRNGAEAFQNGVARLFGLNAGFSAIQQ
jgi:glycosyltransferase involved in cell wall biosynthesis